MYLRTIGRRNKDGSEVRYLQLAHNEWDPVRKCSIAKVVHSFGGRSRSTGRRWPGWCGRCRGRWSLSRR